MRTKLINRYYCDFCKKAGCAKRWIAHHESRCTNNPNRVCGMCELDGDVIQKPIAELSAALESGGIEGLRTAAEGCPACMLAAIRQSGINKVSEDPEVPCPDVLFFDFKEECKTWWERYNELHPRYEGVGH